MNIRMSQPTLLELLRSVSKFVPSKTPMSILRGVYLSAFSDEEGDWLLMEATDLKSGLRIWGTAVVNELGVCVVDCETLTNYVSALDSLATIDLVTEKNKLVVTARGAKASFAMLPIGDWPSIGPEQTAKHFEINAQVFGGLLSSTARIAS